MSDDYILTNIALQSKNVSLPLLVGEVDEEGSRLLSLDRTSWQRT